MIASDYVDSVEIQDTSGADALIYVTVDNIDPLVNTKTFQVRGIYNNTGGYDWSCSPGGSNPIDAKYLPAECRP